MIKFVKQGMVVGFTALVIICAGFYVFIKARSPDSTGLTAQSGDVLTADKWNNLVPNTMVGAFLASTCPTGRKPADGTNGTTDLRGQFLRGLNTFDGGSTTRSDGNQDPDGGSRTLGSYESDSFQGHYHNIYPGGSTRGGNSGGTYPYIPFQGKAPYYSVGGPLSDGTNGTPRTSSETRGKNIAVIFCVRK